MTIVRTDGSDVREFGIRVEGAVYESRPGSYAVITDSRGKVVVIKTSTGYHLPGGGTEPGETIEQTLHREIREECGYEIHVVDRIGEAIQLVFAAGEGYFSKECTFFVAMPVTTATSTAEPDHEAIWLDAEEAARKLTYESQTWAVMQALRCRNPKE